MPTTREVRQCFLQQLKPLAQNLAARIRGEPGDVTAGARQTGDKPGTDRIDTAGHDDRDGRGRLHGHSGGLSVSRTPVERRPTIG